MISITPEDFQRAFQFVTARRSTDIEMARSSSTELAELMLYERGILDDVARELAFVYKPTYMTVHGAFFDPITDKAVCAILHEDNSRGVAEQVVRLAAVHTPLKVLISYSEHVGLHQKCLGVVTAALEKCGRVDGSYLVIFGQVNQPATWHYYVANTGLVRFPSVGPEP